MSFWDIWCTCLTNDQAERQTLGLLFSFSLTVLTWQLTMHLVLWLLFSWTSSSWGTPQNVYSTCPCIFQTSTVIIWPALAVLNAPNAQDIGGIQVLVLHVKVSNLKIASMCTTVKNWQYVVRAKQSKSLRSVDFSSHQKLPDINF